MAGGEEHVFDIVSSIEEAECRIVAEHHATTVQREIDRKS